jgi:hypothetical protein
MGDYSAALKTLSSDQNGRQIFVPTDYYWWGMFYRKSNFARWDEFVTLCQALKAKGVAPIGMGAGGDTAWVASAWFDYLDIRLNGARYHRDLLAGKHSFTDPQVRDIFARWGTILPYFDPQSTAIPSRTPRRVCGAGTPQPGRDARRTGARCLPHHRPALGLTFVACAQPRDVVRYCRFDVVARPVAGVLAQPRDVQPQVLPGQPGIVLVDQVQGRVRHGLS